MSKKPHKDTIHAWIQLHRAHRLLLDEVENKLKDNGLPPLDWYDVLLELQREKDTGLRQFELGERILLNKHNLSRLIDRLQKKQLVARYACEEDGRGNRIKITDKGEKMLKQIWPVYGNSIQERFGVILSSGEMTDLARVLSKVIDKGIE